MRSQIPAAAAAYFERVGVDLTENHPVVSATFKPGTGWLPTSTANRRPVSHMLLVQLKHQGVTDVQLSAPDAQGNTRIPDFSIKSLIGNMGALDAEFADGIPVSEGSGVVADRTRIGEILVELGIKPGDAVADILDRADQTGVEFTVERREDIGVGTRFAEGTRYRLVSRKQITGGGPGYELTVLVYETRKA